MRVALDGRNLSLPEGTGIAAYAATLPAAHDRTELLLATPTGMALPPAAPGRPRRYLRALAAHLHPLSTRRAGTTTIGAYSVDVRLADDAFRTAQVHFDMWGRVLHLRGADLPDVMHWTAPLPLYLRGVPNLVTLHDLIPLRTPNLTANDPTRTRRMLRAIAARADALVAVSQATRDEFAAAFPEHAARVTVVPSAVHVTPQPAAAVAMAKAKHGLDDYFIMCGSIEPRKNLPRLITAFRAASPDATLVLCGPDAWRAQQELAPFAHAFAPGGPIRRLRYVPRDEQLALLQGARALLFPSLAEGFGLPILEAMTLGVPVLTSRGGATQEVAGDAALLVDAADTHDITRGIASLADDAVLRQHLAAQGRDRVTAFAPALHTVRMRRLYEQLA